ncbi:hypothetical protein diail_5208 [Diaporthe ilicicola]|nr:hypothetical protein diail_5208 [Diaporthe ilicicola]
MKLSLFTLTFVAAPALATWGGSGGDGGGDDNCKDSGDNGGWKRFIRGRTWGDWGHGGGGKDCSTTTGGWGYQTQPSPEHTKSHHGGGGGGGEMTYSTIFATSTHTITSCAPEVTDCPGEQYTTVTVAISTTLCPVTETQPSIPVVTPTPPVATPPQETTPVATPPVVSSSQPTVTPIVPPLPVTTPATLSTRTTGRPSVTVPSNGTATTRPPVVTAGAASNGVGAGVALAALVAAVF